jgi:penicillin amidase
LLDWDCAIATDSAAATLYEFWVAELRDAVAKLIVPAEAQKAVGKLSLQKIVQSCLTLAPSIRPKSEAAATPCFCKL